MQAKCNSLQYRRHRRFINFHKFGAHIALSDSKFETPVFRAKPHHEATKIMKKIKNNQRRDSPMSTEFRRKNPSPSGRRWRAATDEGPGSRAVRSAPNPHPPVGILSRGEKASCDEIRGFLLGTTLVKKRTVILCVLFVAS
jgi:hypothetical protein